MELANHEALDAFSCSHGAARRWGRGAKAIERHRGMATGCIRSILDTCSIKFISVDLRHQNFRLALKLTPSPSTALLTSKS